MLSESRERKFAPALNVIGISKGKVNEEHLILVLELL